MEGITIYKINAANILALAHQLGKKYEVYGPVNTHDEAVFSKYRFKQIEPKDFLELHYPTTPTPPTKYVFPARETVLEFSGNKEKAAERSKSTRIIFGLNLRDLKAINHLDKIFSEPILDKIYENNRKSTLLISIDEFDTQPKTIFDLHFRKLDDDNYIVWEGSKEGKKIIAQNLALFTKHPVVKKKYPPKKKHRSVSKEELIKNSKNDVIWDKLAEICFGCGICSYVCPMCYCFEVEDKVNIKGVLKCTGCRERRWDSCMQPDFASISSHDFREKLRDRIYNWYHHKFVRMPAEHGFSGCVGCKRCITYCPARISFKETLDYLEKKYG